MGYLEKKGGLSGRISEGIDSVGSKKRLAEYQKLLSTVDPDVVRIDERQGKPYIGWGVMWLENLPYCFVAYKVARSHDIQYLNGTPEREMSEWSVYAPKPVHEFTAPALSKKPLSENEKKSILQTLSLEHKEGEFAELMSEKNDEYRLFAAKYASHDLTRALYAAVVEKVCNARMMALR